MGTIRAGEQFRECVERHAVIGIVEDRDQNDSIGDIEIRVARRQAAAFEYDWTRHRNFDHVQALAILIARGPQTSQIVVERGIAFVLFVRFDHHDDRVGRNKTVSIVNVAVRVVSLMPSPSQMTDWIPK